MSAAIQGLRREWRPMLALALPVVLAELGWMSMGVVDTMMVGRVGPEAIGAVGIGRAMFFTVTVFGMGLLLGLDTFVSRSWGEGRFAECQSWLLHGIYLSLVIGVPITALLLLGGGVLNVFGIDPAVLRATRPYLAALSWSAIPLLLYTTFRRYLQGISRVRAVMVALISANVVNVCGNWILIYGELGAPALGAEGAGWSSCIAGWYMALFLFAVIVLHDREEGGALFHLPLRPRLERIVQLLRLGFPAASQLIVELAVFAAATTLAGRLEPWWLAAHQIALMSISVAFMVPLGLSSAGAVRVGQALGRKDAVGAATAGWTALFYGATFMLAAAVVFVVAPRPLVRLFSADERVLTAGATLLAVAALFQLFDGVQVVATGALRGVGDTRTPLFWNLIGHWVLGLPSGYYLCFVRGWGAVGLWVGWLIGLTLVGAVLLVVWSKATRRVARELQAASG